jgi:hypothetical protein
MDTTSQNDGGKDNNFSMRTAGLTNDVKRLTTLFYYSYSPLVVPA